VISAEPGPLPVVVVLLIIGIVGAIAIRRFDTGEARLMALALAARVASVFLQVWITRDVYFGGDMLYYFATGRRLAESMARDWSSWAPLVLDLVVQRDPGIPLGVEGVGTSTGTMAGLAAFLLYFTDGSLYASGLLVAFASWVGTLCIYLVFRNQFGPEIRTRLLVASMLLPSVVYWTSGIQKEAVALAGMGPVLLGLQCWSEGGRAKGVALAVPGVFLVALTKPYVLFAIAIASAAWLYWRAATRRTGGRSVQIRPLHLGVAAAVGAAAITLLGRFFPRYSFESLGEEMSRLQTVGQLVDGGSNYAIVGESERSLAGQLAYAPLALATSLFRPLIFEARNAQMVANALETTALIVLLARAVLVRTWARVWAEFRASPPLVFAAVFTVIFGLVVGLASTNLGSLSRYRVPLMPFFGALVLVVQTRRELPGVDRLEPPRPPERPPPRRRPRPLGGRVTIHRGALPEVAA
jgi:hypothetical protein